MLILHLQGGLGNQMFQYAAGKALAARSRRLLGLDTVTGFESDRYGRRYVLGDFAISAPVVAPEEAKRAADGAFYRTRMCRQLEAFCKNHLRRGYVPSLLRLMAGGSGYLDGYWQSEHYFTDFAPVIRAEFTCRRPPREANRELLERILGMDSVSVHVRRERYPVLCSAAYYAKAVEIICAHVAKPTFIFFGDDRAFINSLILDLRQRFRCSAATGSGDDVDDFCLMRSCKHHIIANSSFSWWAAWLSERPGTMVVAPQSGWTGKGTIVADALPSRWVALPNAVEFELGCQT